jgi:hypothetical protein
VPWYVRWRLLLEQYPHLLRVLAHDVGRSEPFRDADSAIAALKQLDYARICALWDQTMKDVRLDETGLPEDWFMREEEVRDAAKSGFTIGAHTVHHPILTHEFEEIARREVTESKRDLEALTGLPVRHFAYPNGDHNEQVVRCVQEAGYATAVTTQGWLEHSRVVMFIACAASTCMRPCVPTTAGGSARRCLRSTSLENGHG